MTEQGRVRYDSRVSKRGVEFAGGRETFGGVPPRGCPAFCFSDMAVAKVLNPWPVEYNKTMSITPKPSPVPQIYRVYLMGCDACGKYVEIKEDDTLPPGWRQVEVAGWIGCFHACSEECRRRLDEKLRGGSAP